jgi:hypothetical protein
MILLSREKLLEQPPSLNGNNPPFPPFAKGG